MFLLTIQETKYFEFTVQILPSHLTAPLFPFPRTTRIELGRKIGDTSSNPPLNLNLHIFIWGGGQQVGTEVVLVIREVQESLLKLKVKSAAFIYLKTNPVPCLGPFPGVNNPLSCLGPLPG